MSNEKADGKELLNIAILKLINSLKDTVAKCQKEERICRDLLHIFQPWPPKKSTTQDGQTHTEITQDKANSQPEEVPTQEMAELNLLDEVINKAEKTRIRLNKKLQKEQDQVAKDSQLDTMNVKDEQIREPILETLPSDKDTLNRTVPKPDSSSQKSSQQSGKRSSMQQDGVGVVSQKHLHNLLKESKPAFSKVGKGGKRFTPAHAQAPFQTKPSVKPLTRPSSAKAGPSRMATQSRTTSTRNPIINKQPVRRLETRPTALSNKQVTSQPRPSSKTISVKPASEHSSSSLLNPSTNTAVTKDAVVAQNPIPQSESSNTRMHQDNEAIKENIEPEEPKRFNLAKDGKQLEVPGKLKKLLHMNYKLRMRVKSSPLHQRVSVEGSARQAFVEAVERHNRSTLSEADHQLWQNMVQLNNTYCNLKDILERICKRSDSDRKDWHNTLADRHQLIFILDHFNQLEGEYRQLREACQDIPTSERLTPRKTSSDLLKDKSAQSKHDVIKYSSRKSILCYNDLQHQLEYLRARQGLISDSLQDSMKWLESLHSSQHRDFHAVYRSMFSLLCTGGRDFPALIADNAEEREQDINDF